MTESAGHDEEPHQGAGGGGPDHGEGEAPLHHGGHVRVRDPGAGDRARDADALYSIHLVRKQSGRCKKEEWQKKSLPNKPQISPSSICTYKVGGEGTHLVRSEMKRSFASSSPAGLLGSSSPSQYSIRRVSLEFSTPSDCRRNSPANGTFCAGKSSCGPSNCLFGGKTTAAVAKARGKHLGSKSEPQLHQRDKGDFSGVL